MTVDEAVDRFIENKRVAITYKRSANAGVQLRP